TTAATRRGCAGPTGPTTSCRARRSSAGRPGADDASGRLTCRAMARDRIPTGRVRRTAKIGSLAAGQAVRQAGTRAANVTRSRDGAQAALERRQLEAAEQIVTVLGTMKGAAMKLGQVLSFLDVGLVPE